MVNARRQKSTDALLSQRKSSEFIIYTYHKERTTMKAQMKTQTCILCGKDYQPRCAKSYFCLECYLNDYLPNKHKYSIGDFEDGLYSLLTKKYYERFWGRRPGESGSDTSNGINHKSPTEIQTESNKKIENDDFRIKCTKSPSPEYAHKRLVDAICSKMTYVP
ncbi:hypothetical protein DMR_32340 [Solidesulfovibrio magneticus RS-1]|uniref:Uncharacterized protein n=1 Tax=Solidesulfovibrio magneticus (strain ATCC 700980 / DSM 13731 / RS-1) TaxID=573370 RepID=C4XJH5_SOLM1|nr:hypothetical protein DMR_32340 [Solidesulfovibrio magneticus RS-1]